MEKPSIERSGKHIQRREAAAKLLKTKQQRQTIGPRTPFLRINQLLAKTRPPICKYLLEPRKPSWKNPAFMKPFVLVLHLATKSYKIYILIMRLYIYICYISYIRLFASDIAPATPLFPAAHPAGVTCGRRFAARLV